MRRLQSLSLTGWLMRRYGRRSVIMWHFALLWIVFGLVVLVTGRAINPGNAILYENWPLWVRVAGWWTSGVVACVCAFRVAWQDKGWWALCIMPMERAIGFSGSVAHYFIPGYPPGMFTVAFLSVLTWLIIFNLIRVNAGADEDTMIHEGGSDVA